MHCSENWHANFTINLSHWMQGIDYVNVKEGASNKVEQLFFFKETINVTKADHSVILAQGDSYHGQLWIPSWTLDRASLKRYVGQKAEYIFCSSLPICNISRPASFAFGKSKLSRIAIKN